MVGGHLNVNERVSTLGCWEPCSLQGRPTGTLHWGVTVPFLPQPTLCLPTVSPTAKTNGKTRFKSVLYTLMSQVSLSHDGAFKERNEQSNVKTSPEGGSSPGALWRRRPGVQRRRRRCLLWERWRAPYKHCSWRPCHLLISLLCSMEWVRGCKKTEQRGASIGWKRERS